jgi:hypothetical protein
MFRVEKSSDYTVMSNRHLKEKDMSLKAKGLLSLMLSLPDDWDYSMEGLISLCKENETAIRSALDELEQFGYLIIDKKYPNQTESGRIEYEYNIYEKPDDQLKNQDTGNLHLEKQVVGNEGQLNTNKQNTNKSNTKRSTIAQKHTLLNSQEPKYKKSAKTQIWVNSKVKILQGYSFPVKLHNELLKYFQMLVESGTLLPDTSIQAQLDDLVTVPEDKRYDVVHKTIGKGWKSLEYAVKEAIEIKRPAFDTAKNSQPSIREEGWQKQFEGEETF